VDGLEDERLRTLRGAFHSCVKAGLMLIAPMLLAPAGSQTVNPATTHPEAWQIVQMINQARAAAGTSPLQWDAALAEAARQHGLRMAAEGSAEHQYTGEPAISERAGQSERSSV
jgi:uncharacterized protein YkwD